MNPLWTRLTFRPDGPTVGPADTPVADVIERLESGTSWDQVASSTGLAPADLIAALAADALGDDDATGPALVQQLPHRPRLAPALAADALPGIASPPLKLALSAGLLQIADFWDASHVSAQSADDRGERDFSPYWHGIAHRREPDPGNASYWFRRVGRHPLFGRLGLEAQAIPDSPVRQRLWDPFAMIEVATSAGRDPARDGPARRLQRLEMLMLLNETAGAAGLA